MFVSYQKIINQQLDGIRKAMQQFPTGARLEEIKVAADLDLELRTLQRRLEKLTKAGTLKLSGTKRAAKYHLAQPDHTPVVTNEAKPKSSFGEITLSNESREILDALSVPFDKRQPIN